MASRRPWRVPDALPAGAAVPEPPPLPPLFDFPLDMARVPAEVQPLVEPGAGAHLRARMGRGGGALSCPWSVPRQHAERFAGVLPGVTDVTIGDKAAKTLIAVGAPDAGPFLLVTHRPIRCCGRSTTVAGGAVGGHGGAGLGAGAADGGLGRSADTRFMRKMARGSGAMALGGGIWSTHFIGILAFTALGRGVFDPWMTALSMLLSAAASRVALRC